MPQKWSRKLHSSWFLAWLSTGIIVGLALAYWFNDSLLASWQAALLAGVLSIIAIKQKIFIAVPLIIASGLLFGLWRGGGIRQETQGYHSFIGSQVQIKGTVADDITHKNGEEGIKLNGVSVGAQKLGGEIWAGTNSNTQLKRGDQIILAGKLKPGFGTFAASLNYASLQKVYRPSHADIPREARDKFTAGLNRALPQPAANLGIGYLTGQHNNLPPTLTKQMQNVGLIHLVIAGGYNVTILVRLMRRGFGRVSKYLAILSSGLVLFGLTMVAGFSAPMARTAIVTGLSLAAWYYGRKIHPLVLLPVSAAITALVNPTFVWGDVGWYMTFVAYGGLILLAPALKRLAWKTEDSGLLKQILADTLAVQIVTMPLMAFAFGQYSAYGLLANLLVLPLMPLTMLFAAVAGLAGMVLPIGAAHIVGWPASVLLNYTYKMTVWFANAPGASAGATISALDLTLIYGALLFGGYLLLRKTNFNLAAENIVE